MITREKLAAAAVTILTTLGLGTSNSATAQTRNTYSGIECMTIGSPEPQTIQRFGGITNFTDDFIGVVCPVTKAVFDSTGSITVAVSASDATCSLRSFPVFNGVAIQSASVTFPPGEISGQNLFLPSSQRGETEVLCRVNEGGRITNYLALE